MTNPLNGIGSQSLPRRQVAADDPAAPPADWRAGLPVLTGERVTLRELQISDASTLYAEFTTPEALKFGVTRPMQLRLREVDDALMGVVSAVPGVSAVSRSDHTIAASPPGPSGTSMRATVQQPTAAARP